MNKNILGIDLGATNIRGGLVAGDVVSGTVSARINSGAGQEQVLQQVFSFMDALVNNSVTAIGIGVPGLVIKGTVYDVVNIPSWKEIELQLLIEERYQLPVLVNNDANCFALGEFYFGKGVDCQSMIGLTIGSGLGSGIIINKKLYSGSNCGAGEFGMMDYLDKCYEYYASGQFFQNVYGISGETVFEDALAGSPMALKMYEEMGAHLGNAIKAILYALDVELIVLGGSVRHAFPYFSQAMWQRINTFAYTRAMRGLRIEVSAIENSGILGAAALHLDHSYSR